MPFSSPSSLAAFSWPWGSCTSDSFWISFPALSLKGLHQLLPSPLASTRSRTSWGCRGSRGSFSCRSMRRCGGSGRPGLRAMKSCLPQAAPAEPLAVRISYLIVWISATARNALVVLFAGLVAYSFQVMGSQPFRLTGSIPQGLPAFRPPHFSLAVPNGTVPFQSMVEDMGVGLAVVPLMGLLETIAIAKAFASQSGYRIDPNQELLALGVANVLGSFVSSYPITGSFGRTAVNAQSGVCTPAGGLVTGALVLLSLAYLTSLFYYIPKAALAAVIISAVVPMFDAGIFRTLWRVKRLDLVPLCVTFLLCFWEVQYGIMAGVLVSGILLLYSIARPPIKVSEGAVLLVQLGSSLHFPAMEHLRDSVCSRALAASPPRSVILDCCHVSSIDYTVVVGLSELLQELRRHGLSLAFCGLKVCGTSATPPQAQGGCVLRGSAQLPSPVACADLSSSGTVIISSTFISMSWRLRMQGAGKGWVLCAGMAGGSAPEGWEVDSPPLAQVSLPSGPCSPGPPVCRLRRIPAFPQLGGGRAVRGSGAGGQRGRALHQHCREHGAHPVR